MSDTPFFPDNPHAKAGPARVPVKPVVEDVLVRHLLEHGRPSLIHADTVRAMLATLRASDSRISENDLEAALNKYGYVVNEISAEIGDYKFIG